jgi:hypothetical protein
MAVRAVWCEPVSGRVCLLSRERTGIFSFFDKDKAEENAL